MDKMTMMACDEASAWDVAILLALKRTMLTACAPTQKESRHMRR